MEQPMKYGGAVYQAPRQARVVVNYRTWAPLLQCIPDHAAVHVMHSSNHFRSPSWRQTEKWEGTTCPQNPTLRRWLCLL